MDSSWLKPTEGRSSRRGSVSVECGVDWLRSRNEMKCSRRSAVLGLLASFAAACRRNPESGAGPQVRAAAVSAFSPGSLVLPNRPTSVKFAVIGDSGRGSRPQFEVAAQMVAFRKRFRYPFVLMVGDNIYEGPATSEDYRRKFEEPYAELLQDGVKFFAVLGNHDDPRQIDYRNFNMGGERYYSFAPPEDLLTRLATRAEFFALDSTNLDRGQLRWLDERLAASKASWKVCFFHHPVYTSGRYRTSALAFRFALAPILVAREVDVAFSGHEHIYQRSHVINGVQYFISGGAGSLRLGDGTPTTSIAKTFSEDYHFMLVELDGDELHFQAIARNGRTIDAGVLYKDGADALEPNALTMGTPAHH